MGKKLTAENAEKEKTMGKKLTVKNAEKEKTMGEKLTAENAENLPLKEEEFDTEKSNLLKYAKRELKLAGYDLEQEKNETNKWIAEKILELIVVFAKQGHSGSSASYCIDHFNKLASFEPLTPLTGNDDEWVKVSKNLWQNNRCFSVFKEKNGKTFNTNGKIFVEKDGTSFTNKDSIVYIEFPYMPKIEYVYLE